MHGRIARQKPFLSRANQKKRLQFAIQRQNWTIEDWSRIVFSDESKFKLYKSDGRTYIRRSIGEALNPQCVQQMVKHGGGSVMVWGAFTFLKTSNLVRINHRMKAVDYTEVLKENLIPFLELFPESQKVFQQDNALIHTAKRTMNFLEESGIEVLEWPPQSPDQNPIEHLWEAIDRSLRLSMHQANGRRNLDHLFHYLQEAWQSIPDDVLFNLLNSMPARIEAVIRAKGAHTRY